MSTTTLYLGSMALSDLLILLGLPFDLYRLWRSRPWIFGQLLCRLSHYLAEACTYCTILHITALTAERYLAICFPLKAKVVITKRRVKAVIGALWAFALLSAAPFFFLVGVQRTTWPRPAPTARECKPTPLATESGLLGTMLWVTTSFFFLPILCLSVLYGLIGRALWRNKSQLRGPNAALREKGHRHTIKILDSYRFSKSFEANDTKMMLFSQYFNIFALQLFYLSASINPILYNLISKKYRAAAYKLLLPHRSGERTLSATRDTETSASIKKEYMT
uniref:Motilin receptor n=1 Tax=Pelodiscus sinensis TaxID=13735 RepID=K7F2D9_PELSI